MTLTFVFALMAWVVLSLPIAVLVGRAASRNSSIPAGWAIGAGSPTSERLLPASV